MAHHLLAIKEEIAPLKRYRAISGGNPCIKMLQSSLLRATPANELNLGQERNRALCNRYRFPTSPGNM